MYGKIKDFILGFVALCGAIGAIYNYLDEHSEERERERITNQALRFIAREETDMDVVYIRSFQKEVRASNGKAGFYWFYDKYARKVFWDNRAKDFYFEDGNARTYLKQIK